MIFTARKWSFMSEITTVNDLVLQHAANNKRDETGGDSNNDNNNQQNNDKLDPNKKDGAPDDKAEIARLKQELEDLKKTPPKKEEIVQKTPEELAKEKSLYEANLIQFAAANDEMKPEEFSKLSALQAKADQDLVFDRFAADHREDNPAADEDEIRAAFEEEYKIKSTNEKTRARGESRLKKEAGEMRAPLVSSYEKVKNRFDNETQIRQSYPGYVQKIEDFASESIPAKMEIFNDKDGEEDVLVDMDLTDVQKKEITDTVSKAIQTPENYALYKEGKLDEIKEKVKNITELVLWSKHRNEALKKLASAFSERGVKKARIGPTESFALRQQDPTPTDKKTRTDKEQEVLDSLNRKK